MMSRISTKLTKRLDSVRAYPVGISAEDVKKVRLDPSIISDILECLDSPEMVDNQIALFFSDVLIAPGNIPDSQEHELVSRMEKLSRGPVNEIRPTCYKLLRRFRSQVQNYRDLMLKGLRDANPMVRKESLLGYETYCQPKEVTPLEEFENDNYVFEISMNGPLQYELRNLALETIERVVGKSFKKTEKVEATRNGEVAFWWDWTPYHDWKNHWLNKLIG